MTPPRRPSLLSDRRGVTTVEYTVLFVLIAIATIVLFTKLGSALVSVISG